MTENFEIPIHEQHLLNKQHKKEEATHMRQELTLLNKTVETQQQEIEAQKKEIEELKSTLSKIMEHLNLNNENVASTSTAFSYGLFNKKM